MNAHELIEMVAVAVGGGVLIGSLFFKRDARIKRALRRARTTNIAAVRDGEVVKIAGTVRYGERTIKAALSGRTCTFYSVVVEDTRRESTYELIRDEVGVDFYVEDTTGVALVRIGSVAPSTALVRDREFVTTTVDADKVLEPFLKRHGQSMYGVLSLKNLTATEGVVEAGERVAVVGLARWMADPDAAGGNYRETPMRLVLEGSESAPLLLSDAPSVVR